MSAPSDPRVDELRQQLRALGYLDAGVDRFVLGPARGARGPVALAIRASVRVGLLGGVLLGPAAAIGVGARLPGLIGGVRDAIVIALYLGLLFFVAVTVASLAISVIAVVIARTRTFRLKAEASGAVGAAVTGTGAAPAGGARNAGGALDRVSRAAGLLLIAATLGYLTLWWRNANAGFGWSAPVWTSFALVVASAISLLLGHAQRMTTLAVLAAAFPSSALPAITNRPWRGVLAAGTLAFAGAAALLLATARSDAAPVIGHPPLPVVGSMAPLRLIALDGFDRATYQRLEGSLPNLAAAFGGPQIPLQPQDTGDPARAWTTIATGMNPEAHGVYALETRRVAGLRGALTAQGERLRVMAAATDLLRLTRPSVTSASDRKAKTVWEVAEDAGLRTAVINWWGTWPAPPAGKGLVVTDRGVLRLEHGGPLDGEISPPPLYETLRSAWPAIRARARESAARAFAGVGDPSLIAVLRRSAELDATIAGILRALPGMPPDLDVVYLPGLDIAQNALLGAADVPLAASSMASRVDALAQYYAYLDGVVGSLLDPVRLVVVVTQPGRVQSSGGGVLALWPGYRASVQGDIALPMMPMDVGRATPATPVDVAPTLWFALGLPLSRELAGAPIPELFGRKRTDRYVPTYGRPDVTPSRAEGRSLDQEMIDRLRSLGYVK
jgi:hypothetical protein